MAADAEHPAPVARWLHIRDALLDAAAYTRDLRTTQHLAAESYPYLRSGPAFGRDAANDGEVADRHERVVAMLDRLAAEVSRPVSGSQYPEQTILCWWSHVCHGTKVRAIPHHLARTQALPHSGVISEKGVRERMWTARLIASGHATMKSKPAIEMLVRAWDERVSAAPCVSEPSSGSVARSRDVSEFVTDVSVPDGEQVSPGQQFEKIWRIRNAGTEVWEGRWLSRLYPAHGSSVLDAPDRVPIPTTLPGSEVDIVARFTAPLRPGAYKDIWKMTFPNGSLCFPSKYRQGIWCLVNVAGNN